MGIRLEGAAVPGPSGGEMISEGVSLGAVQVPEGGKPIVLFVEQQTTGGYPKIANVIGADIGRLAQLRPGARFRFHAVTFNEAVAARRAEATALAAPPGLEPLVRADLPSEFLLGLNLVGGVTSGSEGTER